MKLVRLGLALTFFFVGATGCSSADRNPFGGSSDDPSPAMLEERAALEALAAVQPVFQKDVCADRPRGSARCSIRVVTDANGEPIVTAAPTSGLFPADLRDAYKLPASGGNGRLVAIVDGFDSPNAEADMNTYRAQFGIPACTTANGCFKKVNANGMPGPFPPPDPGWTTETAVDLDMVSATCPDCKIMLVIAQTGFAEDLGPAVVTAAKLGAYSISNSYAQPEDAANARMVEPDYNQPGILLLAGSGDNGYDKSTADDGTVLTQLANPANIGTVLAVGGTTLTKAPGTTRGWTEKAWKGSGGGCSSHIPKPKWQSDTGCARRTAADIAAVGDPATGVAYYNGGWSVVGGTSISTPIVTGMLTLLGINDPSWLYTHTSSFFDVTTGSNGTCGSYLCTSGPGYDGPTGVGTPNGAAIAMMGPPVDGGSTGGLDAGSATTGAGGAGGSAVTGAGGSAGAGGSTGTGGGAGSGIGGAGGSSDTTGTTGSSTTGTSSMSATTTTGTGTGTGTSSGSSTGPSSTAGAGGSVVQVQPDNGKGCSCRLGAPTQPFDSRAALFAIALGARIVGRRRRARTAREQPDVR